VIAVHRRHCRDAKFLPDGPPGQTFLIPEPHNLITTEHSLGPSDNLPGSLSGPDPGYSPAEVRGTAGPPRPKPHISGGGGSLSNDLQAVFMVVQSKYGSAQETVKAYPFIEFALEASLCGCSGMPEMVSRASMFPG
jgi:hypothetical protein